MNPNLQKSRSESFFNIPKSSRVVFQKMLGLTFAGGLGLVFIVFLHKKAVINLSKSEFYFLLTMGFGIPLVIFGNLHKNHSKKLEQY